MGQFIVREINEINASVPQPGYKTLFVSANDEKLKIKNEDGSVDTVGSEQGFRFPADPSLSVGDIGKLVMNENGVAVVANRNTPELGQQGEWNITINDVLEIPNPTSFAIGFLSIPNEGEKIRIGLLEFTFTSTPVFLTDIQIETDIPTQVTTTVDVLSNSNNTPYMFTAVEEAGYVKLTMSATNRTTLGNDYNNPLFAPPVSYGSSAVVDLHTMSMTIAPIDFGTTGELLNSDAQLLSGAIKLQIREVVDINVVPNGDILFAMKWATNPIDFAQNIESAIINKYGSDFTVVRTDNVLNIIANNQPNNPDEGDIYLSTAGYDLFMLETVAINVSSNADYCASPILGQLIGLGNGAAIISSSHVMNVKLSGTEPTIINYNNTNIAQVKGAGLVGAFFNKYLVVGNDGTLETFGSFSKNGGILAFDLKKMLTAFSGLYVALTEANPGDNVLVKEVTGFEFNLALNVFGL